MAALIIALILAGIATGVLYSKPAARAAAGGAWRQGSAQARAEASQGWQAARRRYGAAQAHLAQPVRGMDGKLYPPGPRNWQWWWGHALRLTAGTVTAAGGAVWATGKLAAGATRVGRQAIHGGRQAYRRHRDTIEVEAVEVIDPNPAPAEAGPSATTPPGPAGPGPQPGAATTGPSAAGQRPHVDDAPCDCQACTGQTRQGPRSGGQAGPVPVDLSQWDTPTTARRFYPPADWDSAQARPRVRADELRVGDHTHDGCEITAVTPRPDGIVAVSMRDLRTGSDRTTNYTGDSLLPIQPVEDRLDGEFPGQAGTGQATRDVVIRRLVLKPGDHLVNDDGQLAKVLAFDTIDGGDRALTVRQADGLVQTVIVAREHLHDPITVRVTAPAGTAPTPATDTPPSAPGQPAGSATTEGNTEMSLQAEASSLASIKATLSGEISEMDTRVSTLDSLMSSLTGVGMDAETINGLSSYQDTITGARAQVAGLLNHVEARHNQVAEAIAAAGGSDNVAAATFYDES